MFFSRGLPTRGVDSFTVKVPIFQCYLEWSVFLKYIYGYFQELFDLSSKWTSKIDILLREMFSSGEEKITHVCVCGGGGGKS